MFNNVDVCIVCIYNAYVVLEYLKMASAKDCDHRNIRNRTYFLNIPMDDRME